MLQYVDNKHPHLKDFLKDIPTDATFQDKFVAEGKVTDRFKPYVYILLKSGLNHEQFSRKVEKEFGGAMTISKYLEKKGWLNECIRWLGLYYPTEKWSTGRGKSRTHIQYLRHMQDKLSRGLGYWDDSPKFMGENFTAVITKNASFAVHPTEDRFFNIRELMHLMGLPHDFQIDSARNWNHVCQNVPVTTARYWAEQVVKFCRGELEMTEHCFLKQDNCSQRIVEKKYSDIKLDIKQEIKEEIKEEVFDETFNYQNEVSISNMEFASSLSGTIKTEYMETESVKMEIKEESTPFSIPGLEVKEASAPFSIPELENFPSLAIKVETLPPDTTDIKMRTDLSSPAAGPIKEEPCPTPQLQLVKEEKPLFHPNPGLEKLRNLNVYVVKAEEVGSQDQAEYYTCGVCRVEGGTRPQLESHFFSCQRRPAASRGGECGECGQTTSTKDEMINHWIQDVACSDLMMRNVRNIA